MKINVSIFGVSGYTGTQLLSILSCHKNVNITGVFGEKSLGKNLNDLFPNIVNLPKIKVTDYKKFDFKKCDLVFLCLPHSKSQFLIDDLGDCKIIDLSADFRINNPESYTLWYEKEHTRKSKLKNFIYGLSEINRNQIKEAKYIANPGCYPTSILIPLIPLFKEKILSDNISIIIYSKSGISGAGKNPSEEKLFFEVNENFQAYNIEKHRHLGEIEQEIKLYNKNVDLTFTPHLLPVSRGILSTIYINNNNNYAMISDFYSDYFKEDIFVNFLEYGKYPSLKGVNGTNNIVFSLFQDFYKKNLIIVSCIDNLIKGAAGQAIQNMNIMFGFEENESLNLKYLSP